MLRNITAVVLLFVCVPALAWEAKVFPGEPREAGQDDLMPGFKDRKKTWYSEDYTFTFRLAGTTRLFLKAGMSNVLGGKGSAFLKGHIKTGKNKRETIKQTYSPSQWSASQQSFAVTFPTVSIGGTHKQLEITMRGKKYKADLVLKAQVPGFVPGSLQLADQGYLQMVVWPQMSVSGAVVDLSDGTTHMVKGWCLFTHARSTLGPGQMPARWFYFKSRSRSSPVLFQGFELESRYGGGTYGWIVAVKDGKYVVRSNRITLKFLDVTDTRGAEIPWMVLLTGEGKLAAGIKAGRLRKVVNRLEKLPRLQRAIVSKLIQPHQYLFAAQIEIQTDEDNKFTTKGQYKVETLR